MEVSYDFETTSPPDKVKGYLMDPNNLMKYVPSFKSLKEMEGGWELQISWLIKINLQITREVKKDEITYLIRKVDGLIKIDSYLRFVILPTAGRTVVRLTFFYHGPFERIAKRQTEEFYKRGVEIFKRDLESSPKLTYGTGGSQQRRSDSDLLEMKTLLAKKVDKSELDDVLEEAMMWSINSPVKVILTDGVNKVELILKDGDLEESKGEISSLGEKLTVLVKGKVMES
ncbi:MAG: SRPBCC family protein [Metallosphaera sp.]